MKLKISAFLFALFAAGLGPAGAQTATWSGTSANWGIGGNWSTGLVPTSATNIEFADAGGNPSAGGLRPANNINFVRTSGQFIITIGTGDGINASGNITSSGGAEITLRGGGILSAANLSVANSFNLGSRSSSHTIGNVTITGTTSVNSGGTLNATNLAGVTNLGSLAMNGGTINLIAGNTTANGTVDGATNTVNVTQLSGSTGSITGNKLGATTITTGHLVVSGSASSTYAGTISNGAANNRIQLTKSGSGTLTLSGSNSYTGSTTVSAGTLLIAGSLGNTAVAVGGTGLLGGTGTIGGTVTVNAGGQLAPGNSPGRLTVANSVTIADGGSMGFEIQGATVASQYDQLLMTGGGSVFSLTGTNNLVLSVGYVPVENTLFFLVDNQGSSAISGIFEQLNSVTTDLSEGAVFSVGLQQFRIGYSGNSSLNSFTGGNDLVLQAVPEPGTWALLAAGLTVLAAFRRRR